MSLRGLFRSIACSDLLFFFFDYLCCKIFSESWRNKKTLLRIHYPAVCNHWHANWGSLEGNILYVLQIFISLQSNFENFSSMEKIPPHHPQNIFSLLCPQECPSKLPKYDLSWKEGQEGGETQAMHRISWAHTHTHRVTQRYQKIYIFTLLYLHTQVFIGTISHTHIHTNYQTLPYSHKIVSCNNLGRLICIMQYISNIPLCWSPPE